MKKVDFWAKSCLGKKPFKTIELAELFAKTKSFIFKTNYRVYQCNLCFNFHLTKNGKTQEKPWNLPDINPNEGDLIKLILTNGKKVKAIFKKNKFFSQKTGKEITDTIRQWKSIK